jgi:Beta-propeller repeat
MGWRDSTATPRLRRPLIQEQRIAARGRTRRLAVFGRRARDRSRIRAGAAAHDVRRDGRSGASMSAAGHRFFWKVATAATLGGVALAADAPRAAVPQLPARLAVCPAPALGTTWSTRTLGSTDQDNAAGIAVDPARCAIYLAGDARGTIGAASAGYQDAVVARYDTRGVQIWAVQFGSTDFDYVDDVGVDAHGDVFVLGRTVGTLPGSPVVNLGGYDLFLVKLDANGVILWTRMFGSAENDFPEGLALNSTGDVYVTGFTEGVLTGVSAGGQDYFLGRYDTDGNLVMITQRGSAGNDRAKAVAVGPSDNPYVVGDTDGDLEGVPAGNADIFVAKYDPAGTELWIDQRGTTDLDLGAGVAVNGHNEVFAVGSTALGLDGNVSAGAMDVVLIRYSTAGAWQSTVQRGSSSTDTATRVALTASGAPIVAGDTSGTLDGIVPAGGTDAFVMKLSRGGVWSWTRLIGGASSDFAAGVAVTSSGNVYVAGGFSASINAVASVGLRDLFAASWDGAGTIR